jgi:hypothetical protein
MIIRVDDKNKKEVSSYSKINESFSCLFKKRIKSGLYVNVFYLEIKIDMLPEKKN